MAYPVTLNGRTYTLADFEGTNYVDGLPDAFEDFVTHAGNLYSTTSTTSNTIGTGSKTFTVESSKPYQVGTPLRITDSAAPSTNWIDAIVTAYSGTTLTVDAVAYAGSGTKTSWNINIGGGGTSYTGTLPVAQGGTGATTASDARTNLDVYSKADADSRFLNVSGEASDITITGDVGIGGAPDTALHVQGSTAPVILRVEGTDAGAGDGPRLDLYRNSASPAADDDIGQIYFSGEDDGGGKHQYAKLEAFIEDATAGSEGGRLNFNVLTNGAGSSMLTLRSDTGGNGGEVVVNETGGLINCRVEGSTEQNLFVTDANRDVVLINHDTSTALASHMKLQVIGVDAGSSGISITRHQASSSGPSLRFGKSHASTKGDVTIVQDNDVLGGLNFHGADGTDFNSIGAQIQAQVDGTPGSADMPGRLVFSTTADGASSPTERMRIASDGNVGIGDDNPSSRLYVEADDSATYVSTSNPNNNARIVMRNQSGTTGSYAGISLQSENNSNTLGIWTIANVSTGTNYYGDLQFITRTGSADYRTRMTMKTNGDVGIANESPTHKFEVKDVNVGGSSAEEGFAITDDAQIYSSTNATAQMYMNDSSSSAGTHNYIFFRYQGSTIGDIDTTNNSTIRYNTFVGGHWSQTTATNILDGTIMSTIDEMMEWTDFEYTNDKGVIEKTSMAGHDDYVVGQDYTIPCDEDGATVTATAVGQTTDKRLAKVKVSDVASDPSVYGVFGGTYADGDISVESLGASFVRIGSGVSVSNGDLIESAGDGTGRVQADDIMRSSTVAKITSTIAKETFADGSKLYPCTLHCG